MDAPPSELAVFSQACSSPQRPAEGGGRPALGGSFSCPGGAPRNAAGLRCGGAARVLSCPVLCRRTRAAFLPEQVGLRAGVHQVLAMRQQRLPSPFPVTWQPLPAIN
jgi:hypothetical protein